MFVILGVVFGIYAVVAGIVKHSHTQETFSIFDFLKKGFTKTPLNQYTGIEVIILGVLSLISAFLMYWLFFGIYMRYE